MLKLKIFRLQDPESEKNLLSLQTNSNANLKYDQSINKKTYGESRILLKHPCSRYRLWSAFRCYRGVLFFDKMTLRELQKNSPYTAGMTGCGFMVDEMTKALPLFLSEDSDALLKQEIQNNEILLMPTLVTRQKAVREFTRRFKAVPLSFWETYLTLSPKMQILAMFFVLLKAYRLYFDFQVEVVRNKWNSFNQTVSKNDFLAAISDIACNDEFVDSWSDNTRDRVAAAFLSVLRKVGFISDKDGDLRQLEYSDEDLSFFVRIGEPWFLDAILIPPYRIETIKSIAL